MREFGIRLAMGSTPRNLMTRVLREGAVIAGLGIVAGALVGGALVWVVGRFFVGDVDTPGALPVALAAAVLVTAAVLASLMPASRASRVDVIETLRDV
jgi:ABC-type antimicrobial peptide transport system permease subunit